jgi:hypothetical protein
LVVAAGLLVGLGVGVGVGLFVGVGAAAGLLIGVGVAAGLLVGLGEVVGLLIGLGDGEACANLQLPGELVLSVVAIAGVIIPTEAMVITAKR